VGVIDLFQTPGNCTVFERASKISGKPGEPNGKILEECFWKIYSLTGQIPRG
jgi:hypothetical protein